MKFLESPSAVLTAMVLCIFTFGAGLTSPIWLIVSGRNPLDAIHQGTPIVATTIVGLIITVFLAVALQKARQPTEDHSTPFVRESESKGKARVVHLLVMLMFVVPFVTIIIGFLLHRTINLDPG